MQRIPILVQKAAHDEGALASLLDQVQLIYEASVKEDAKKEDKENLNWLILQIASENTLIEKIKAAAGKKNPNAALTLSLLAFHFENADRPNIQKAQELYELADRCGDPLAKQRLGLNKFIQETDDKEKKDNADFVIAPDNLLLEGKAIGQGTSSTVIKALLKKTSKPVAVKKLLELDPLLLDMFYNELRIMKNKNIRSKNIIEMYGCVLFPFCLVLEFAGQGSLEQVILMHPEKLTAQFLFRAALEIMQAVDIVHQQGFLHRDIKLGNILLDDQDATKLADFGHAVTAEEAKNTGLTGTVPYMAPESIRSWFYATDPGRLPADKAVTYSPSTDIYAYGITLWGMLARDFPFKGLSEFAVYLKTLNNVRPSREFQPNKDKFLDDFEFLIKQCWEQDPAKRWTVQSIMHYLSEKLAELIKWASAQATTDIQTQQVTRKAPA